MIQIIHIEVDNENWPNIVCKVGHRDWKYRGLPTPLVERSCPYDISHSQLETAVTNAFHSALNEVIRNGREVAANGPSRQAGQNSESDARVQTQNSPKRKQTRTQSEVEISGSRDSNVRIPKGKRKEKEKVNQRLSRSRRSSHSKR
jgi:hypothetical protein